ncbi:MAG: signal peptide peptidase SppA [bacterium]
MKKNAAIHFIILVAGLALFVFVSVFILSSTLGKGEHGVAALSRDKIAVIEIQGIILDSRDILKSLKLFSEDKNVKGIILRIDSPGGAVAPSQEIYSEVRKIHQKGEKKIVASFGNVAASGAYYIASATDKIISNPGTITGSIGVIMEMSNIQELLDKVGIESYVIKSGQYKDIGSITRPMSEEESRILQSVLDDVHMQFIEDVSKGRGMAMEKVKEIANGSIYSGRQAKGLGLVDDLGGFQDAVDLTKELTGIKGEPALIYEKEDKLDWLDLLKKGAVGDLLQRKLGKVSSGALYLMP